MADVDPALGQEIFDVAQRQRLFHTYIITNRGITFGEMLKYRNGRSWPDATTAKDGTKNWSDSASFTGDIVGVSPETMGARCDSPTTPPARHRASAATLFWHEPD